MFKTTIFDDMEGLSSKKEILESMSQVVTHFRTEFMAFIEEIKKNGITYSLYHSSTPAETIALWENYSADNQELFDRIRTWVQQRADYFDTCECSPMFEGEDIADYLLEIGLIIFITNDESLLCEEDISETFLDLLSELLWKSHNPMMRSAGNYIYLCDFVSITAENIYDYDNCDLF